jgi:uncharacterized protein (DUF2147 family)
MRLDIRERHKQIKPGQIKRRQQKMKRMTIALMTGALLMGTAAMADDVKPKDKVDQRVANQQKRVGKGIESGALTTKEGANVEKKEAAVRKEVHTDRQANGGKLTTAEKQQVNQQQNKLSKQIYDKKHNDKTRGGDTK